MATPLSLKATASPGGTGGDPCGTAFDGAADHQRLPEAAPPAVTDPARCSCRAASAWHCGLVAAGRGRWQEAARQFTTALMLDGDAVAALAEHAWQAATALGRSCAAHRDGTGAGSAWGDSWSGDECDTAGDATDSSLPVNGPRHSPHVTAACPDRLTPREVEVLALLADGLSNREIAALLVVSVRTVGRHVDNIYGKIGVHQRRLARQYARERGIIARGPVAG